MLARFAARRLGRLGWGIKVVDHHSLWPTRRISGAPADGRKQIMLPRRLALALLVLALMAFPTFAADDTSGEPTWQAVVEQRLPMFGDGNLIVIADAAFPEMSVDGVQTIHTHTPQIEVLKSVLASIDENKHLRPMVSTSDELKFVEERDAPGISAYRDSLLQLLAGRESDTVPELKAIHSAAETATLYRVLVLKTDSTLPFTSVFIHLKNGYWSPEAEKRLRDAMTADESK
jgi:L-fucose mutarotase/ribose pyranase (RbsD/FucU family)